LRQLQATVLDFLKFILLNNFCCSYIASRRNGQRHACRPQLDPALHQSAGNVGSQKLMARRKASME
jgi:hypothetical protein